MFEFSRSFERIETNMDGVRIKQDKKKDSLVPDFAQDLESAIKTFEEANKPLYMWRDKA